VQQVAQGVSHRTDRERERKPVVTNTQAWTWEALHGMGMHEPVAGFGQLLRHK
jgi:maleate cis-trans isomerase